MSNIAISSNLLKHAEYARSSWFISIPNHHGKEEILNPEYWTHCAMNFRRGDKIEIVRDDLSAYFHCLIVDSGRIFAKLKLIQEVDLSAEVQEAKTLKLDELEKFEIRWINVGVKYGIFRKSDGEKLKESLATKEDADKWLLENIKSLIA